MALEIVGIYVCRKVKGITSKKPNFGVYVSFDWMFGNACNASHITLFEK